MAITIVAPEATTCMALSQMLEALAISQEVRRWGFENWTTTHSYMLLMGGYEVVYGVDSSKCVLHSADDATDPALMRLWNGRQLSADISHIP